MPETIAIMRIDGKTYKEAKAVPCMHYSECTQCAFAKDKRRCGAAIDGAAQEAFGGDCQERDVIYEEVKDE